MKNRIQILVAFGMFAAVTACKNNDREPDENAAAATTGTVQTNGSGAASTDTAGSTGHAQGKFVKSPERKKLTQHEIDSIKTERGALVTPPDNVGASLTPGSGKAVPSNKKTGPGTTANMGSSSGD